MKSDDLRTFGRPLSAASPVSTLPDWRQADPAWIESALQRALALPTGGWMVVDAVSSLTSAPRRYRVDGRDYVIWRDADGLRAAPDACPHMGASLSTGRVRNAQLVCPWHGLRLGAQGHGDWCPIETHDDGVLLWIRPGSLERDHPTPILAPRPARFLDAVVRREASCEPSDVLANRLDPWHGAHFHPHSFGRLAVIDQTDEDVTVRVVFRVLGRFGVEVDARFHCPDARSIVMTIVRGEGEGSVVETHATPIDPGRCAVVEATLASSDQPGFWRVVQMFGWALRPLVCRRAGRLWVEDLAYAERRFALRSGGGAGAS